MARLPIAPVEALACASQATSSCAWSHHNWKHFPVKGGKRDDTRHGPAKYLSAYDEPDIRALETRTTRSALRQGQIPGRTEYLLDLATVIGWDRGNDATLSFVECSGGLSGTRSFHGRPMERENPRTRAFLTPIEKGGP